MELWDAYDEHFQKIEGVTLVRGEPVPEGMFHLVSDVLVRHKDGTYLLMQRDPRKHHGGMWEATCGGSALRGESPLVCAKRELWEETGLSAETLTELGRDISTVTHSAYVEFFCESDCDKSAVTLQEGETVAYRWVSREELCAMNRSELLTKRMQLFLDELK